MAAELHIKNLISIAKQKGLQVDHSYVSEVEIPKLVDHFIAYLSGDKFSPGSVFNFPSKKR